MSPRYPRALVAISSILSGALLAQEAPQAAPASDNTSPVPTEEVVVLSPFRVSSEQDTGYQANDTISGGRLAVNLLKSPTDVTVLTRDFMDDIGATLMSDVSTWLTGSAQTDITDQRDFGNSLQFRGLSSGVNTRNNFRYDTSLETYAIERVEGSRGPNAIMYGESNAGGTIAVTTKQARFRNFGSVTLKTDSEGMLYSAIDINRKLTDRFAARLNLFALNGKNWIDDSRDERRGAFLAATYQPWKNTSIRVEAERTTGDRNDFRRFTDSASSWDGVTKVTGPLAANPAASTGLSRFTTDQLVVFLGGSGIQNFRNFAQTNGSGLTLGFDDARPNGASPFPVLPSRSYQSYPLEYGLKVDTSYFGVFVEQQLMKNLTLELATDFSGVVRDRTNWEVGGNGVRTDVATVLPDGSPNPNFGRKYVEARWQDFTSDQYMHNYRAALAYDLRAKNFEQIFSVVAMRRDGVFDNVDTQQGRTNGTVLDKRNAANRIWYRTYLDDPRPVGRKVTAVSGVEIGDWLARDSRSEGSLDSLVLSTVGYYFDRKLTVTLGKRYDHTIPKGSRSIGTYDARGDVATTTTVRFPSRTDSSTGGFTFFPRKEIGVYSNYSEGFLPISNESAWIGSRGTIEFTKSNVKTVGLRSRLGDGLLVASVGYYTVAEEDRIVTSSKTAINNIWNVLAKYDASKTNNLIGGPFSTFNDTQRYSATGYELDLTLNLSSRFRLMCNVSLPETKQDAAFPDTIEYYDTHLPEWNNALANAAISAADKTTLQTNIANVRNQTLAAVNDRVVNGTMDYRVNLFGNYSFNTGRLKGLSLGAGVNMYGKQLIGNTNLSGYDYVYADSYEVYTATLGYAFKLWKRPIKAQVVINNLLDYDDAIYRNVAVFSGATYRQNYSYINPRTVSLSVEAKF